MYGSRFLTWGIIRLPTTSFPYSRLSSLSLSLPLPLSLTYSISFFSCSPSSSPCLTLHSACSSSYTSLRPPLLSIRLCLSPSDRSVLHLRFPPPVHVPPHSWFTHPHLPPSSPFSNARRIRGFRKPYAEHLDSLLLILCRCHSVVSKPHHIADRCSHKPSYLYSTSLTGSCRRIPAGSPARRYNASHSLSFGSGVGYCVPRKLPDEVEY